MSRSTWISALVAGAIVFSASEARAQTLLDLSTTFGPTLGLTTTGGVIAIVLLTRKQEPKTTQRAAKSAELFLRNHHLQFAEDLATGDGPLFAELARGLALRPENAAAFGRVLREHRKELLPYCDTATLTSERALAFAQRVTSILETHEGIRADLQAVAATHPLN